MVALAHSQLLQVAGEADHGQQRLALPVVLHAPLEPLGRNPWQELL